MSIPKTIENAAVRATQLKRQIADLNVGLDKEKETIRMWAMTQKEKDPGLTMLEIPSEEGTCSVVFPQDKPEFIKGAKPEVMLETLAPMVAIKVLESEMKYSIVKGFGEEWRTEESFTGIERSLIQQFVTFKPQTPRVEPAK